MGNMNKIWRILRIKGRGDIILTTIIIMIIIVIIVISPLMIMEEAVDREEEW